LACCLILSAATVLLSAPASAYAEINTGVPLDTPFPRVAVWTPDTTKHTPEQLANYDYVVLYDGQRSAVPGIKAASGGRTAVFNLSSASEVALWHELVRTVPNAWFLQQVGTNLTSAVDTATTVFPVSNPRVFAARQIATVDEELVEVVSVGTSSITVKRGAKMGGNRNPDGSYKDDIADEGAHAAGTRIAPLVTRRYGIADMDISTYCPEVTVDSAIGPETWGEFMARVTAERCNSADWDGVAADRVENNESFLVNSTYAGAFIKSIDPTRRNRYVTDRYAAFDRAWIAGVRHHLEAIRNRIGPHKVIVANNGAPHYDLINGSNIESFPRFDSRVLPSLSTLDSYPTWWSTRRSFYSDWATKGKQPNFSTVMTYYWEPEPVAGQALYPIGSLTTEQNKWNSYQKMRFGLATAMMNDGFFTYQLRVWGVREGLFWFDEYDNNGQDKGYLGMPISDERLALPALTSRDALGGDGSFSSSAKFGRWHLYEGAGYDATARRRSGAARIRVSKSGSSKVGVIFYHSNHAIRKNSEYTVRFRAKADRKTTIRVRIATKDAPWHDWVAFYTVPVDTSWRTYEYSGHSSGSDSHARLVFDVAGRAQTIWLDDVRLQPGSRLNVYRRDFEGGAVLVNGSSKAVTVPLGTTFKKIAGDEVPAINNGANVTSVSIPSRDGLVLLRASSAARVPTYLSIRVSSAMPSFGVTSTVSGRLRHTTPSGSGVASGTVTLQTSSNGSTGWKDAGSASTSRYGYFSFSVKPVMKTFYRVRYAGRSGAYSGRTSAVQRVTPKVFVSTPVAPPVASLKTVNRVYGELKPRHTAGSSPVRIYRWKKTSSGSWKRYGYVTARASDSGAWSKYSSAVRLPYRGTWRLRAYAPADSRHAATWSRGYVYVRAR